MFLRLVSSGVRPVAVESTNSKGDLRLSIASLMITVGKVSTDRQYKKFSGTDGGFFCTVGI